MHSILITSPNAQFAELAKSVAAELGLAVILIEAVLEEAVAAVREHCRDRQTAAIISRGGTADMIRAATGIPVLKAEANDFDLLLSLAEAMTVSPKIAYVLYAGDAIDELPKVTTFFNIDMRQYFFTSDMEMIEAIRKARADGFRVVVSGSDLARKRCEEMGLACVMVNTSRRTVEEVLRRAMLIQEIRRRESEYREHLQATFTLMPGSVLFLDSAHRISLINRAGLDLLELAGETGVLGKAVSEYFPMEELSPVLDGSPHSGLVIEVAGKTALLDSVPVAANGRYLGTVLSLQRASEVEKLEHSVRRRALDSGMAAKTRFEELERTACSRSMRLCLERAKKYAVTDHTILLEGESGTGKELLAQSVHNGSSRGRQPFVAINCAALPLSLLESELFGYEEGAFTGAKRGGKPGYFELAHGGTLFLDELGLLPLHVQMQLLRVLQEKQVLRVGGRKMIPVDVRVIAATNADLAAAVQEGSFRQDLYYRINVLRLVIPPLRRRPEDIPALAAHWLGRLSDGKKAYRCGDALMDLFRRHNWPGNVRELINYLMRLVVCADGEELTPRDLAQADILLSGNGDAPALLRAACPPVTDAKLCMCLEPGPLARLEKDIIGWHMNRHHGNRAAVCRALGISRTTLWKKLKEKQ